MPVEMPRDNNNVQTQPPPPNWLIRAIEALVFMARWVLIVFILGLLVATVFLAVVFVRELGQLLLAIIWGEDERIIVTVTGMLDKFMLALVLVTTATGTYVLFLRPFSNWRMTTLSWLEAITVKDLEIAMLLSLGGVSAVLLFGDIFVKDLTWYALSQLMAIHSLIVLSAMAIALIFRWMHSSSSH